MKTQIEHRQSPHRNLHVGQAPVLNFFRVAAFAKKFLPRTTGEDNLRQIMTWSVCEKFKESATAVQDHRLIALTSSGDLIAQEVKCHTVPD